MRTHILLAAAMTLTPVALRAENGAPQYRVDSAWPKPLPEGWVVGGLGGLCVDRNDHVLILNRQDVADVDLGGGKLAPAIIEFDPSGNVVNSWGDAKLLDPRLHSCFFDKDSNVWIASAPSGMVQKYSHDGSKLLQQIGKKGVFDSADGTAKGAGLNSNAAQFYAPSSIFVDPQNGDVYVADGEGRGTNRRIAVMDREGKFLRQWQPDDMRVVHCMSVANDGLVYVCNRDKARLQVYDKTGKLVNTIQVREKPHAAVPENQSRGVAVALDLSRDPEQKLMYLINQNNAEVEVMDRKSGKILASFGSAGHFPGQFDQLHGIAVDSKGNIYIAENHGQRVQKFSLSK